MSSALDFLSHYWRVILFILALLLIFWIVWILLNTLLPFIVGLILAYLLMPIIKWLENKLPAKGRLSQTKRILLILFIFLIALAAIGLLAFFTIPAIISSVLSFFSNLPKILPDLISRFQAWTNNLRQLVPPEIRTQVDAYFANLASTIGTALESGLLIGFSYLRATFGFILGFVSLPVFLFYLLKDEQKLSEGFYSSLSPWWREHTRGVVKILQDILGRYFRATLVLALAVAVLDFIGLMILGIPFAPALAFWAGLTEFIPILGPWLGGAAGVLVTLSTDINKVIPVAALYFITQTLENVFLVPRIHGQFLKLHPAIILILLVLGGHFAGIWGIILAVPLTATFVELVKYMLYTIREEGKITRNLSK